MLERGWHRAFDDPIPLPNGGELHTLRDAANYITRLPKREHDAPAKPSRKPQKATGQKENVEGKKPKEASAKTTAAKPGRKSA
jgi:hypothetical protein